MKTKLHFALIALLLLPASIAHADSPPETTSTASTPYSLNHDFRFDVSTGIMKTSSSDGGFTLGATVLRRSGFFEYGLDTTLGNQLFSYSYGQVNAAGGLGLQTRFGLRLDALGEFGGTYYNGVGKELLSSNPGVNGIAPSVRAKVGASYVFSPMARDHFVVGLWLYGDDDLTRETKSIAYAQNDGFRPGTTRVTESETIGTSRLGAMVSLGGVLPF
ncbi:MAG: hypothetical protein ABI551_14060 [Polyangiaceae bacterium]